MEKNNNPQGHFVQSKEELSLVKPQKKEKLFGTFALSHLAYTTEERYHGRTIISRND